MKNIPYFSLPSSIAGRVWVMLQVLLWSACLPGLAHAQCSQNPNGGAQLLSIALPATLTIPRDAVVGTIIGQATISSTGSGQGVTCGNSTAAAVYTNLRGGASTGSPPTIPTGLPGIGYQLTISGISSSSGTSSIATGTFSLNKGANVYLVLTTGPLVVKLIKTGPVTGTQTLAAGPLFSLTYGGLQAAQLSLANATVITGQTCSVTTSSIAVPLGSVPLSTFTGVGSNSATVPFSIGVNCSGVSSKVYMTLTDSQNAGNTSSTLGLTSASTAAGVGIQILYNSAPVSFGPDASVAGNPNQFSVFTSTGSSSVNTISLGGRYVQSTATVTPGTANGVATFTMSYQ